MNELTTTNTITRYCISEDGECVEASINDLYGSVDVGRNIDMALIERITAEYDPKNFPDTCDHCDHIIEDCDKCGSVMPRNCLHCGKELL